MSVFLLLRLHLWHFVRIVNRWGKLGRNLPFPLLCQVMEVRAPASIRWRWRTHTRSHTRWHIISQTIICTHQPWLAGTPWQPIRRIYRLRVGFNFFPPRLKLTYCNLNRLFKSSSPLNERNEDLRSSQQSPFGAVIWNLPGILPTNTFLRFIKWVVKT